MELLPVSFPCIDVRTGEKPKGVGAPKEEARTVEEQVFTGFLGVATETTVCGDADVGFGVHAVGVEVEAGGRLEDPAKASFVE